jgi:hypothetical protein
MSLFRSDCTRRPSSGLCSLTGLEAVLGRRRFLPDLPLHAGVWSLGSARMRREFRNPAEPAPPPVKEPVEPPENPHVPVREPDPEDPNEI